ncbi:Qat anti-phage system associated protein QatB [Emticicia sp. 17c]|uniref:Qat anti-phage system associated protein QatB n=1 Tax=Emticicia sp. 17c TaxID=3127704 RepID=UPI00301CAB7F
MGTSASSGGAGGSNPLIPSWIGGGGFPTPEIFPDFDMQNPEPFDSNGDSGGSESENDTGNDNNNSGETTQQDSSNSNSSQDSGTGSSSATSNRYTQSRRQFNAYVRGGGQNSAKLKSALKGYSRNAAGGPQQLARRMEPAASRVSSFYTVLNTVQSIGKNEALIQFNLSSYQGKTLLEVLSSLTDEIFKDTDKIYEDTQDDSITKQAYSNTIVRICELGSIDLDSLTNEQIEVMLAIFIEESIAQRVINDIGNGLTQITTDIKELVQIEENIYQIINGLVRNQIMPEIIATQRGDKNDIERKIENIYRIAFDTMAGLD